jgi:hypothetical protein
MNLKCNIKVFLLKVLKLPMRFKIRHLPLNDIPSAAVPALRLSSQIQSLFELA